MHWINPSSIVPWGNQSTLNTVNMPLKKAQPYSPTMVLLLLDQLISWRDVASWTFWRKSIRSSASLPAWVVVMSIQSFMSFCHLLVGLPLPLLPSILASKMCLSSVSWRLMWPKYLSFSVFAFCRSIVVFISNLESTSLLVTFSIQDILKIFL